MDKSRIKNIVREVLCEIKINNPLGKLKVRDEGSSAYVFFSNKDNPDFPIKLSSGQNWFRKFKNYITIQFIDNPKDEIEKVENWLKKKGIYKYQKFEKQYPGGEEVTRINIPLDKVEILPGEGDEEIAND